MVRIGLVGLGYWGPNLARIFGGLPNSQVTICCDLDEGRLQQMATRFRDLRTTNNLDEVLDADRIDAVVIATPTRTHHALARRALERGLHTFVEKPLATSIAECEDLIALAEKKGVVLFVGHVFLYTAAVNKLKQLIASGELGDLCYIASNRLNLGPVRSDVNALWDLAPHDISIILHLMGRTPVSASCQGLAFLNKNLHDVAVLTMHFENGTMAVVHSSWLDPNKVRRMTLVGNKKMAVYDDVEPLEKIKIYDKGVEAPSYYDTFGEFHFSYRYGDTYSPRLLEIEPLKAECQHFIECLLKHEQPRTDGYNGMEVVRVLEAADLSLHNGGARVPLKPVNGNGILITSST